MTSRHDDELMRLADETRRRRDAIAQERIDRIITLLDNPYGVNRVGVMIARKALDDIEVQLPASDEKRIGSRVEGDNE